MISVALAAVVLAAGPVAFPSAGGDVVLAGVLLRPDGEGPFPAVVLLHGCGGLRRDDGALLPRHAEWAERLRARGYLVLLPDSFRPRGVKGICRSNDANIRATRERRRDAEGALAYLRTRRDVAPDEIAVMGWSNGGTTALAVAAADAGFKAAIALYPACGGLSRAGYRARIPVSIFIGEKDDWNPAEPCRRLGDGVTVTVYPGALHDFDAPPSPPRTLSGVPTARSGTATLATDAAARRDVFEQVPRLLDAALRR